MKLSTTRVVEGLGLSFSEHTLLTALVAVDTPLTQTQLADRTGLSPSGITNQIDRLERRGLVERTPDVRDRRAIVVRLTDEGRRLVWQALDAVEDEQNEVLEALAPAEIEAFTTTLRRVSRILRAGDAWNSSQRP
jgi:DNA-binding MarR family transcriptional regulator